MGYYFGVRVELELQTGVWSNVAADVIGNITGNVGISGVDVVDRVASAGSLNFTLENTDNKYTVGHSNALRGFGKGTACRLVLIYEGKFRTRFYGRVNAVDYDSKVVFGVCNVTVLDFMEQLAAHEMYLPAFATSKRMDEIMPLVVANMPVSPLSTNYQTGSDTFATAFDLIKVKTKALQEINKVAMSELGYVYVTQTTTADEVLVSEGRNTRSTKYYSEIYYPIASTDNLITEASADLELEQGGVILLESLFGLASDFGYYSFNQRINRIGLAYGDGYYNFVRATVYPRKTDAAATTVLFFMDGSIELAAGEVIVIVGQFRDPNNEAVKVGGRDMVAPVATTDYLFNTAADGSGTNITASLTVAAVYGSSGVEYTITNGYAGVGYITRLQSRGKGVYIYNPITSIEEDANGQALNGIVPLEFDMQYQHDPLIAKDIIGVLIDQVNVMRTDLNAIEIKSASSIYNVNAFLDLGVGSKILISAYAVDIIGAYFIHSIDFTIQPSGFGTYTYGIKNSIFDTYQHWILDDVNYSVLDTTTILGF